LLLLLCDVLKSYAIIASWQQALRGDPVAFSSRIAAW
jgi:hypothetical protein